MSLQGILLVSARAIAFPSIHIHGCEDTGQTEEAKSISQSEIWGSQPCILPAQAILLSPPSIPRGPFPLLSWQEKLITRPAGLKGQLDLQESLYKFEQEEVSCRITE